MINVTKTFLPPIAEYTAVLQRSWDKHWITNRGELVLELEAKLKGYLQAEHMTLTTNGTIPLQIAIRALGLKGEIITTPFSYVATTSSIVWESCRPVFVDIDRNFLTIDPSKIEEAITPATSAILATHVFGNPCDVDAIAEIARRHDLKVIYDSAHAFGVDYKGKSIFRYGDVSTCSFHATKIFHTGEGGAMFCDDEDLHNRLFYMHNFGHKGAEAFQGIGINGKMSELQAAMGLAVFPYFEKIRSKRRSDYYLYEKLLSDSGLVFMTLRQETTHNYSYFPVIFETETQLKRCQAALNAQSIYPRRYFYPSLHHLPYVSASDIVNAEQVSTTVLCLPLYYELEEEQIRMIVTTVKSKL